MDLVHECTQQNPALRPDMKQCFDRIKASVRPGIRPGFRSMSLTDAPTRRYPESQFRSLSVAQLPVRPDCLMPLARLKEANQEDCTEIVEQAHKGTYMCTNTSAAALQA